MAWQVIVMEGGLIFDRHESEPIHTIEIDLDELQEEEHIADAYYFEALEWLRGVVPPGRARKHIRRQIKEARYR